MRAGIKGGQRAGIKGGQRAGIKGGQRAGIKGGQNSFCINNKFFPSVSIIDLCVKC
jgi:hypothetical protein